jgi:hypothetical protein
MATQANSGDGFPSGAWHWPRPGEAPPSIVLGYGGVSESAIRRGIAILGDAIAPPAELRPRASPARPEGVSFVQART